MSEAQLLRVRKRLSTGHKPGEIVPSDAFRAEVVPKLLRANAVSAVYGPPLSELPKWKERAKKLEALGIATVVGFIVADDDALREALGYKTLRPVQRFKRMLLDVVRPDGES